MLNKKRYALWLRLLIGSGAFFARAWLLLACLRLLLVAVRVVPLLLPAVRLLAAWVLLLVVGPLSLRALIITLLVLLATAASAVPPIRPIILPLSALLRLRVARRFFRGLAQLENTAYGLL